MSDQHVWLDPQLKNDSRSCNKAQSYSLYLEKVLYLCLDWPFFLRSITKWEGFIISLYYLLGRPLGSSGPNVDFTVYSMRSQNPSILSFPKPGRLQRSSLIGSTSVCLEDVVSRWRWPCMMPSDYIRQVASSIMPSECRAELLMWTSSHLFTTGKLVLFFLLLFSPLKYHC